MQDNKRTWPTLLLSILPILCASSLFAQFQGQPGQYDQNDPPASIARIGYTQGNVSLQAYGTDDWSQAPPNYPMVGGDRLYTGPRARAVVQLGGAELRLWQATDVTLTNVTDQFQQIGLAAGTFRLRVFEMSPGSQIEVDTPNGAAIVESAGDYRFEAFPQNSQQDASSIVTINSGNAQITGPGINQAVSGGYSIGLFGTNPVQLQYLDVPDYDDLDYWSIQLDQRLQNSVSARYVSRQMVGYGDLDTYGSWNPNTEYGPGWFPNQVPNGWQPYSTGHWAYVQPWGYTWVDDAPWGFAPFHYGRWSQVGGRWGWFPGPPAVRPVYSPALVAFVGGGPGYDGDRRGGGGGISIGINFGGGVGISAWFPIGVGEPYVPWYRCSPRYAQQVNTSNVNVAVIRNTTVVNNYNTYINKTVINNTVINNTTVNNTTVNNFNYANRSQVTAVPASAVASGASVTRQAIRLTPEQQQQVVRAPIAFRPTAPVPATPHPSLGPAVNVGRPVARPVLMTPGGAEKAVPNPVQARPVVISKLPPPRVVPANAPPPPAAPKPIPVNHPSAPVPVVVGVRPLPQPASPVRPAPQPVVSGQPAPAPVSRPTPIPTTAPKPVAPESAPRPAPQPTPVVRPAPQPVVRPGQPEPQPPVVRPNQPVPQPQPVVRPSQPVPPPPPPQQQPQPVVRPSQPVPQPPPQQQPQQVVRPSQPVPQPIVRPAVPQPTPAAPQPAPARPVPAPVVRPAPPTPQPVVRPAPPQPAPARPEARPLQPPVVRQPPPQAPQRALPPAQVKPAPRPENRPAPKEDKKPDAR